MNINYEDQEDNNTPQYNTDRAGRDAGTRKPAKDDTIQLQRVVDKYNDSSAGITSPGSERTLRVDSMFTL